MVKHILAGTVCTPEQSLDNQLVSIDAGKISGIESAPSLISDQDVLDVSDGILIPGLIDLQVNGALGWSFQASHREHYDKILDYHLRNGTTTLLPTLVTAPKSVLLESLQTLAEYIQSDPLITLPGIHVEGPFLAPAKSGAHDTDTLRLPDMDFARELYESARGCLVMTTIAPELDNAPNLISFFAEHDVIVSAGHTAATYQDMIRAIDAGLSFITHAGNASDWPHRAPGELGFMASEPGVVGALMAENKLGAGIILDGYHFHPALVKPLLKVKGADNLVLVSDASTVAGCVAGEYESGGLIVTVHPEGFATSGRGGGWLAGSVITLLQAVQVAVKRAKLDLRDAVKMASLSPAQRLQIDDRKGQIKVGHDADLLVLNQDLSLRHVIVGGILRT